MISYWRSPIGSMQLSATDKSLNGIGFLESHPNCAKPQTNEIIEKTIQQLGEYFSGSRSTFSIPLDPDGTSFQELVWKELQNITCGSTISYKQLAKELGDPKKVRAVGRANGKNPIPIIIPCHRVTGSDNSLTGYAGGIKRKKYLLQHEGAILL